MSPQTSLIPPSIDSPLMRHAGADLLSLALIDARNHTLRLMAECERLVPDLRFATGWSMPQMSEVLPPVWLLGHAGWFQEYWVGRNTQRHLGLRCPLQPSLLASIEPCADVCFDPCLSNRAARWTQTVPDLASIKSYLLETLETTLELLDKAVPTDEGLYFFRLALAHEDQLGEQFMVTAQALGLKLPVPPMPALASRMPLLVPSTSWSLGRNSGQGAVSGGFSFANECPQHEVKVPEFEIDAQPVSWAQYVEFVGDGGYDNMAHWSEEGQHWLKNASVGQGDEQSLEIGDQHERRAPRYVAQIGVASGAVMQMRFGSLQRMAGAASAAHLSWYEAQAYAHWAGRRLPTEVEWEIAASRLKGQGFRWGDVWEWSLNTYRPYAGFAPAPGQHESALPTVGYKALRGASWAMRERMKHATFRGFARPTSNIGFYGFRTCAN